MAALHFVGSEPLSPTAASGLGQIVEWTAWNLQVAKEPIQLRPRTRRKAIARSRCIHKLIAGIVAEDQGVKVRSRGVVAADNKLLPSIDTHLLPGAGALTGLIGAVQTLRNQS